MNKDKILHKIDHLSRAQKILLFSGAIGLSLLVYWFFFFQPQYDRIESLEKNIKQLQKKHSVYEKKVAKLPQLEKKYQSLEHEFIYAETLLPETSQGVENLLSAIEKLGNSLGVEFILFVPGTEKHHNFYATRSVTLRIQGPFHNLMHFFSKMSRLDRLVTLESAQFQPQKADNMSPAIIEANTKISVYRSLTQQEQQAKATKKKK
jgi:type IV pilus assembly protein PilO